MKTMTPATPKKTALTPAFTESCPRTEPTVDSETSEGFVGRLPPLRLPPAFRFIPVVLVFEDLLPSGPWLELFSSAGFHLHRLPANDVIRRLRARLVERAVGALCFHPSGVLSRERSLFFLELLSPLLSLLLDGSHDPEREVARSFDLVLEVAHRLGICPWQLNDELALALDRRDADFLEAVGVEPLLNDVLHFLRYLGSVPFHVAQIELVDQLGSSLQIDSELNGVFPGQEIDTKSHQESTEGKSPTSFLVHGCFPFQREATEPPQK